MQMERNGCLHTVKPDDVERFLAAGWVEVKAQAEPKPEKKAATKKTK